MKMLQNSFVVMITVFILQDIQLFRNSDASPYQITSNLTPRIRSVCLDQFSHNGLVGYADPEMFTLRFDQVFTTSINRTKALTANEHGMTLNGFPFKAEEREKAVFVSSLASVELPYSNNIIETPGKVSSHYIEIQMFHLLKNAAANGSLSLFVNLPMVSVKLKHQNGSEISVKQLQEPLTISYPISDELKSYSSSMKVCSDWVFFKFYSKYGGHNIISFKTTVTMPVPLTVYISLRKLKQNEAVESSCIVTLQIPSKSDGHILLSLKKDKHSTTLHVNNCEIISDHDKQDITVVYYYVKLEQVNRTELTRPEGCINVDSSVNSMRCFFWNELSHQWDTHGCWVSQHSNASHLICQCNHMTVFSGGFFVVPNSIDIIEDSKLFLNFFDNPVVVSSVAVIWMLYSLLMLWARRKDKADYIKTAIIPLEDNEPDADYGYLLTIMTGWGRDAGTTSNVACYLMGDQASSSAHALSHHKRKVFESGSEDWFLLKTHQNLGEMLSVTLWHDNSGTNPSWLVAQVSVRDMQTHQVWHFVCNRWLAVDRVDGSIECSFRVASKEELTMFKYLFLVNSNRNLRDGHLWLSIFLRPARSPFSRKQRLTCALCLVLTTMLTNLMFYGIDRSDPEDQHQIADIKISLSNLVIGIQSGLIVFPVNLIVVQLFRLVPPFQKKKTTTESGSDEGEKISESGEESICLEMEPLPQHHVGGNVQDVRKSCDEENRQVQAPRSKQGRKKVRFMNKHLGGELVDCQDQSVEFISPWLRLQFMKFPTSECSSDSIHSGFSYQSDEFQTEVSENVEDVMLQMQPSCSEGKYVTKVPKDVDEEDGDNASEKKKEEESKSEESEENISCVLPSWLLYVAWTLSLSASIVSSYFICLYGLKFSYKESIEWMTSFFTSFFTSACVIQPMKVICLAAILTYIFKDPVKVDDRTLEILDEGDEYSTQKIWKPQHVYQPLSQKSVRIMRKIRGKEVRMWQMLKEIGLYSCFGLSLSVIIYGHLTSSGYLGYKSAFDTYIAAAYKGDVTFGEVSTVEDMWSYINGTLIPSLYPSNLYNGEPLSAHDEKFTADMVSVLCGPVRLRQIRMKATCSVLKPLKHIISKCHGVFGLGKEDREDYSTQWEPLVNQSSGPHWKFQSAYQLRTTPVIGKYATYIGSGYVVELKKSRLESSHIINQLITDGWVDHSTAALIIEFTTYNVNQNAFTIVVLVFEFLGTGMVAPYHQITVTTLFHFTDEMEILVIICEVTYIGFIFLLTFQQVKLLLKFKCKAYFQDPWNYVEFSILVFSYSVFVVFFIKMETVKDTLKEYHANPEQFVSFYVGAFWNSCLLYLLAALQTLIIVKFVQLISFNPFTLVLSATLHYLIKPLMHYFLIMFIVIIAFGSFASLCFGTKFEDFSTVVYTFMRLFNVFIGEFDDFDTYYTETGAVGGMFFVVMIVVFYYLLLNVMLVVIVDGFYFIKNRFDKVTDYDLPNFIWNRFLLWSGLGRPSPDLLLNNDQIIASETSEDFEQFPNRIRSEESFTDEEFESLKERRKTVRFAYDNGE